LNLIVTLLFEYFSLLLQFMQLKNSLISFLLIFSYSFGFAHNLVPHCTEIHTEQEQGGIEHHDKHHEHQEGELISENHSHIAHADHYDDGLIDLLVCALENAHHNDDTCDLDCYSPIKEYNASEKAIKKLNVDADWQFSFTVLNAEVKEALFSEVVTHRKTKGLISVFSYRGPPIHS